MCSTKMTKEGEKTPEKMTANQGRKELLSFFLYVALNIPLAIKDTEYIYIYIYTEKFSSFVV